MNYLTLINQFWTLRREVPFSSTEADLYFYLLNVSNGLKWKNPFQQANLLICATLGISEKTLIGARNRLKQYGLIDFASGVKRAPSTYKLLLLEYTLENLQGIREECDSESDSVFDSVSGGNAPDINKHKQNQTKPNPTPAAGVVSASSSSTLPAEEKQVVPPVAQPPRPIAAESQGPQHSEASKALAAEMATLWHITELRNARQWMQLARFTHLLEQRGELAYLAEQFAGYRLHRQKRNLGPHNLGDYLGLEADGYDGQWKACDWPAKAKATRSDGETTAPPPARAATSPTKAKAHNWS